MEEEKPPPPPPSAAAPSNRKSSHQQQHQHNQYQQHHPTFYDNYVEYPLVGMRTGGYLDYTGARRVHHARLHTDDVLNINVGGKKYTIRRTDLLADPRSKLADWFRPGTTRLIPADKGGNYYLDRDPKVFRHILGYLRLKKERCVTSLALPSKPDDLAKLVGECESLNLVELREMALEMLQKYLRTEEQHYVTSYVQMTLRDYDAWQFEQEQNMPPRKGAVAAAKGEQHQQQQQNNHVQQQTPHNSAYDEWDQ